MTFGTRIVQQEVKKITAIDFDPVFIEDAIARYNPNWPITLFTHNMLEGAVPGGPFDSAFCLDVLEHIDPTNEQAFMNNLVASI
jgi:2-polyprenyl-3-methyl-5-hydroxy-6-metoxy-1,4-benzoquinol methylase